MKFKIHTLDVITDLVEADSIKEAKQKYLKNNPDAEILEIKER